MFIENKAVIVIIPESNLGILNLVCNTPVIIPAKNPQTILISKDKKGFKLWYKQIATTAPPNV